MNEVEQKALELKGQLDALTEKANNAVNKEAFTQEIETLKGLLTNMTEKSTQDLEHVTEQLNQLKESLTIKSNKKEFDLDVELKSKESELRLAKSNPAGAVELKAPATMLISTHTIGDVRRTSKDTQLTDIMSYKPTVWDDLPKVFTNAPKHYWTEKQNIEGDAGVTAEGAVKPLRDFEIVARSAEAVKIAVVEKASKEILDDVDGMRSFITTDMSQEVQETMEYNALRGAGTAGQITGIYTIATAFNAGGKTVVNANLFDVLRLAVAQITIAGGRATTIVLNPFDMVDLDLAKDTNGAYILPPFTSASGTNIKGVKVIEDVNLPVGEFMVYDRTKAQIRIREDIDLTSGYENDDFRRNLVMFIAEARLFNVIKENHKPAFVKGNIATAIASITPEPAPGE